LNIVLLHLAEQITPNHFGSRTPLEVAAYDPDSTLYDQLLPTRLEELAMR